MKKLSYYHSFMIMIAAIALMTFVSSCKKDKNDAPPEEKPWRLTSLEYSQVGYNYTNVISYNSDNKIVKISGVEDGVEVYKNDWEWNGNEVIITEAVFENGVWYTNGLHKVMTYLNGHLFKNELYAHDTLVAATTYMWNGDLLTKEAMVYFNADTLVWDNHIEYTYENSLLISAEWYRGDELYQKQVIEYANEKPVALKLYNPLNVLQESSELIYTGNNITKVNSYRVFEGAQGNLACTEERTYDANNCLSNANMSCTGAGSYSQNTTYEEGKGNLNDYLLTEVSWISVYLFPDTFPSELAYKK